MELTIDKVKMVRVLSKRRAEKAIIGNSWI